MPVSSSINTSLRGLNGFFFYSYIFKHFKKTQINTRPGGVGGDGGPSFREVLYFSKINLNQEG